MNRYQCIKNYYVFGDRCFTAGSLYNFHNIENTDLIGCVDNLGITRVVDEELRDHFQELQDIGIIDDPYIDHDSREYDFFLQNHKGCSRWFTWSIVIVATILAFLYWALFWRS